MAEKQELKGFLRGNPKKRPFLVSPKAMERLERSVMQGERTLYMHRQGKWRALKSPAYMALVYRKFIHQKLTPMRRETLKHDAQMAKFSKAGKQSRFSSVLELYQKVPIITQYYAHYLTALKYHTREVNAHLHYVNRLYGSSKTGQKRVKKFQKQLFSLVEKRRKVGAQLKALHGIHDDLHYLSRLTTEMGDTSREYEKAIARVEESKDPAKNITYVDAIHEKNNAELAHTILLRNFYQQLNNIYKTYGYVIRPYFPTFLMHRMDRTFKRIKYLKNQSKGGG